MSLYKFYPYIAQSHRTRFSWKFGYSVSDTGQVRSGMGARAATALRRAHLSASLPRPTPGDRPGLRRAH